MVWTIMVWVEILPQYISFLNKKRLKVKVRLLPKYSI